MSWTLLCCLVDQQEASAHFEHQDHFNTRRGKSRQHTSTRHCLPQTSGPEPSHSILVGLNVRNATWQRAAYSEVKNAFNVYETCYFAGRSGEPVEGGLRWRVGCAPTQPTVLRGLARLDILRHAKGRRQHDHQQSRKKAMSQARRRHSDSSGVEGLPRKGTRLLAALEPYTVVRAHQTARKASASQSEEGSRL